MIIVLDDKTPLLKPIGVEVVEDGCMPLRMGIYVFVEIIGILLFHTYAGFYNLIKYLYLNNFLKKIRNKNL